MNGWIRLGLLTLVTVALAAFPFQTRTLQAQEASARFRILVPRVPPAANESKKFGERLGDELRDRVNDMATHQPVEEDEIKDALKKFDLDWEDLNCVRTRQLGQQIQAELVFCGSYTREGDGWRVEGSYVGANGEALEVEPITVANKGHEEAAEHFFAALEQMVEQLRFAQFCGEYADSEVWESALTACDRAIELNPNSVSSRYTRAMVLRETDQPEEALVEFQKVLELDPLHENAMQNAGYISALLGQEDQARDYYSSYLELNPTNAQVRMRVAYELAQAGDPQGAMQLIEAGLEIDPENVDLLKQHAGFAFAAGAELAGGQSEMPPEAAELYEKALESFTTAYEADPEILEVRHLRSMMGAHLQLEQFEEAVALGERLLETHGDEAQIWSVYADALQRSGQVDEAIAALEEVLAVDPDYPTVRVRQASWLMEAGRLDEAIPVFEEAIAAGEQSADAVANVIFANGYNEGVSPKNWDYAVRVLGLAREFDISPEMAEQVNFWLGYAIFNQAVARQEAQTLETAQATLPRFQEALRLFQNASGYAARQNMESTRQELIGNVNTYIEIQEAIIRRGR
ncbi:MAG: tetratricopeptide repeat protein [Gemmatimonadota bacterium]